MAARSRPRRYARDLRKRPKVNPWIHMGMLAVGLVVLIAFGGRAADNAAGCFSSVSNGKPAQVIDRTDGPVAAPAQPVPAERATPAAEDGAVKFEFRLPDAPPPKVEAPPEP
jgi:hypothetical protein